MKNLSAFCWWALAIVFFTETVKSASNTHVDDSLPNETYPEHYNIELTTNIHLGEKTFKGEVTIDIVVVNSTSKIVLHAGKFIISNATIVNPLTGESEDLSIECELKREFLTLTRKSGEQFSTHPNWKLTIIYSGELRDDYVGFYITYYEDDGELTPYATTNFKPTYARHAFPCYDEPNKRANFSITINHSRSYRAISNMPVNSNLSRAGQTVFLTTPPIPTYRVAFIVSHYKYTNVTHNNLPQRMFSPNTKLHEGFLSITSQIIEYVSDHFDVQYMLPKLDHVGVNGISYGTMSNWGLIMYELSKLTDNFKTDILRNYETLLHMAQQIVEQWVGNYVTMSSWQNFWLTEGLARLYAIKSLDHIYPEWNTWDIYELYSFDIRFNYNIPVVPNLVSMLAQRPRENKNNFMISSPYKSTCILSMWNNALSDTVFQKGLGSFLKKNQYKSVGPEVLFNALEVGVKEGSYQIPATINVMISSWTNQGGYPILTVARNYSDGTFKIKQEANYLNKTIQDSKTWYVPINYAVASNPNFSDTKATHYLRNITETNFTDFKISNNDWLILNKQATGYYTVNYDLQNWNLIIKTLIENPFAIHRLNRAAIVSDAIQLYNSNRLDVSILFKLFTYFKQEEDKRSLHQLAYFFEFMQHYLMTNDKYDDLKYFFAELINPIYEKLLLTDKSRDNFYQEIIRDLINSMANNVEIRKYLEPEYNILNDAVKKNKTITHEMLTCNAMKMADDEVFNNLYELLLENEDESLTSSLTYALSCHKNITLVKKVFKISIDDSIDLDYLDRRDILFSGCRISASTFSACIEFLNEHWNVYGSMSTYKGDNNMLHVVVRDMAFGVTDKHQEEQYLALVNKVKNSEHVPPNLEERVKSIICERMKLVKKYVEEIMPWVEEYRREAVQRASGLQ